MNYSITHENRMRKTWSKMTALLEDKNVRFKEKPDHHYLGEDYVELALTANTSIGKMEMHLYDNWLHTRFENNKKAVELFGDNVNKFNGKHNFHPGGAKKDIMNYIYDWFEGLANTLDSVYNEV